MASTDITAEVHEFATLGVTWEQLVASGERLTEWCGTYSADNSAARNYIQMTLSRARDRAARQARGATGPAVTDRQADYITALGGTVTPGMTRSEASTLIESLKARRVGARHGVHGEIWD